MSRFIVSSGSYFRPFEYDELVKPVQQSAEAHAATADAYEQLSMQTEALGRYISENKEDEQAKALYDNYLNKLNSLQESLWNNGYNAQARRDLSSARATYASDITRLQSAIQSRQERSKEYWDARHKNPDLVTGFDPGTGGLDNYLKDSEYGRNWYSYSGNQFANEVGAEAKARAAELVSSYATRDPDLAGYLEYHVRNGFTNAQVNNAGVLAQRMLNGQVSLDDPNIDPIEGLLATTLISRLQATGAMPGQNVSPEEFGRLFNYGMLGLAQGIGGDDPKLVADKIWDLNADFAKQANAHRLSQQATQQLPEAVHREPIRYQLKSADADKIATNVNKEFNSAFENGPVSVKMPDGSFASISSHEDAMDKLMRNEARDKFLAATGIDVGDRAYNWIGATGSKQYGNYKGVPIMTDVPSARERKKLGLERGDAVIKQKVNGKWVTHDGLTSLYNEAKHGFKEQIKAIDNLNGRGTVASLTTTPEESRKIRERYDLPSGIPDSDLEYAMRAKYLEGDYYAVPIIQGPEDDDNRKRFANAIAAEYRKSIASGNNSKTSASGFYEIGKGGTTISKNNVTATKKGLDAVFVLDKNGQIDPDSIESISILPNDISVNYDSKGNPVADVKVRIVTPKGVFVTDINNLGADLGRAANGNIAQTIAMLMYPLTNGVDALDRNSGQSKAWASQMYSILGDYTPVYNGMVPSAQAVVRNDYFKDMLLDSIDSYVSAVVANGLNPNTLHARQHVGYTSTKSGELGVE